jgi:calcium-dependent phosphoinositide phospholipase C
MSKLIAISLVLGFLVIFSFTGTVQGAPEGNCQDWDQSVRNFGEDTAAGDRPVIGRLETGKPYNQLLTEWISDNCMRLNNVQVLGTHNSYHVQPRPALLQLLKALDPIRPQALEFTHRPLDQQLGQLGIRQVEIDVYADPGGGLFAFPLGGLVFPKSPPDPDPFPTGLRTPGLKVMHYPDIDFETTCTTFVSCLQTIRAWSDSHPRHLPIMVLVEAKDDVLEVPPGSIPPGLPQLVVPLPFDVQSLDEIDAGIRSVFPVDKIITPDAVRGSRATLEEAVLRDGWPTLNESRGRVMFGLDNTDEKHDLYVAGHPSLRGRVMFTNSLPGSPEAAFVEVENPITDQGLIKQLVRTGYIVRTRADADTLEARSGRTARRDAALSSGAQFVSTDYPEPDPALGTGYFVGLPGGTSFRCNPVLSPPGCALASVTSVSTLSSARCGSAQNLTFRLAVQGLPAPDDTFVTFTTSLGLITPATTTTHGLATASLSIPPQQSGTAVVEVVTGSASIRRTLTIVCP